MIGLSPFALLRRARTWLASSPSGRCALTGSVLILGRRGSHLPARLADLSVILIVWAIAIGCGLLVYALAISRRPRAW